jgi:hypothetical protein
MDQLTAFLSSMIALSVGVERVVEVLKGFSKTLREDPQNDPGGTRAARRRAVLQIIAVLAGTAVAALIGPHHFFNSIPDDGYRCLTRWIGSLLLGCMASGGSALWNHALDIVGAIKSAREQVAQTSSGAKTS